MDRNVMHVAHELKAHAENESVDLAAFSAGISEALARELLQLTRLDASVANLVAVGLIDRQVALRLAVLSQDKQRAYLDKATRLTLEEFDSFLEYANKERMEQVAAANRALTLGDRIVEQLKRGRTYDQIRNTEGMTMECLVNRLALLELCVEADSALRDGSLPLANAIELAHIPKALQVRYVQPGKEMKCTDFVRLLAKDEVQIKS